MRYLILLVLVCSLIGCEKKDKEFVYKYEPTEFMRSPEGIVFSVKEPCFHYKMYYQGVVYDDTITEIYKSKYVSKDVVITYHIYNDWCESIYFKNKLKLKEPKSSYVECFNNELVYASGATVKLDTGAVTPGWMPTTGYSEDKRYRCEDNILHDKYKFWGSN